MPLSESGSPPADPGQRMRTPPRCRVTTPPKVGNSSAQSGAVAVRSEHARRPPPDLAAGGGRARRVAPSAACSSDAGTGCSQASQQPQRPTRRPPPLPRMETRSVDPACDSGERVSAPPLCAGGQKEPGVKLPLPPPPSSLPDAQVQLDTDADLQQTYAEWYEYGL